MAVTKVLKAPLLQPLLKIIFEYEHPFVETEC